MFDEIVSKILIRNKKGDIIAEIDLDRMICSNNKFSVRRGYYEDVVEIRLNQKTYS